MIQWRKILSFDFHHIPKLYFYISLGVCIKGLKVKYYHNSYPKYAHSLTTKHLY